MTVWYRLKAFALATGTGVCFLGFWSGSVLLSWVILPLVHVVLFRRPWIERTGFCRRIVGRGFRLFLAAMRATRTLVFYPNRTELQVPDGPVLMIANHPTLIDVTALMAICPRVCCVAKPELFRSVLVGRLLRLCGHIEGGESGSMEGAVVIRHALQRLECGQPVLIFPEGTRSPRYGLRRFKPGAFEIARRASVPIVPILITCEPPTLIKGLSWYALPKQTAHYRLRQLPTVACGALEGDAQDHARHFQTVFLGNIETWRSGLSINGRTSRDSTTPALASGRPQA